MITTIIRHDGYVLKYPLIKVKRCEYTYAIYNVDEISHNYYNFTSDSVIFFTSKDSKSQMKSIPMGMS